MDVGLLWFDDRDRPIQDKLAEGAEAYRARCGRKPNAVYMHTSDYAQLCLQLGRHPPACGGSPWRVAGLKVIACNNILPCHFWIGREK